PRSPARVRRDRPETPFRARNRPAAAARHGRHAGRWQGSPENSLGKKIPEDRHPHCGGPFGMVLHAHEILLTDGRREGRAVRAGRECGGTDGYPVTVHEVGPALARVTGAEWMLCARLHFVPAHVRHPQVSLAVETPDRRIDQPEAIDVAFLRMRAKELHAEAH